MLRPGAAEHSNSEMQHYALTVDKFLDHAAKWHGDAQVVSVTRGDRVTRIGYADLHSRANRLSGALTHLGLNPGDRVATLGWNTQQHVEIYYAAMGAGFVCHTLNPRLTGTQLAAMVNEAEDRVIAVGAGLNGLLEQLLRHCPCIEYVVMLDDANGQETPPPRLPGVDFFDLDVLLATHGRPTTWGNFDEHTPAGLCYTSGTTGPPKGVLYTHRSNYLHTLRALQAGALAFTARDVVLAAVPMCHANGWGLPFAVPAVGAKLVLPGRHLDGRRLASLMLEEGVTVAVGVQTVWLALLDHLDAVGGDLPALERIIIGGSHCPDALIQRMEDRLQATVQTSWGMTELSPLGTIVSPTEAPTGARASGRPVIGLDLKLTDEHGGALRQQRNQVGRLKVKGASAIDTYFRSGLRSVDDEGYFDTGDLAILDDAGSLTITGRSKDLIKSGGEWINPAEIESIIGHLPAVALVAVIARPDAKWGERPVLIVEPRHGHKIDDPTLLEALRGKVPSWWIPDRIVQIANMPLAATGKIDKNELRIHYGVA